MKTLSCLALLTLVTAGPASAANHDATVTESYNKVTYGSSQSADSTPAPTGTVLQDGDFLKTGAASRAEMKLPNLTITRVGANTIFNYSASTNELDLQAGTVLFSKPKDGQQLNIKTEAVTAAILGTTGFIQIHGHGAHTTFVFGIIEGKAHATANGHGFTVLAGQLLQFTPGGQAQVVNFDVPRLVHTSGLIKGFHHPLPNQVYIDKEIATYNDLVQRGFIRPPQFPYVVFDPNLLPIIAFDSAGKAIDELNRPVQQPSNPNPPTCPYYTPPSSL